MDRDSFGLTEDDYGFDDDEAFEQYGLFTSAQMFQGAGYRGYSGEDVVTMPSMAAAARTAQPSGMSAEMAMEMSIVAMEEAQYGDVADEFAGLPTLDGSARAKEKGIYDINSGITDDYWGDEDEDALMFGFGEF